MRSRPAPPRRPPCAARFVAASATAALALLIGTAAPRPAAAQRLTRPERRWTTFETAHFRVHAPAEFTAWSRAVAERLEAVWEAERRAVGFAPAGRTDVVVDDPYGTSNGSAYPFLRGPAAFLWPVPPGPRSAVGNSRDWGELLAVHEFAHLAHLTRPSRNPWQRTWRRLLPAAVGPVATRSPRWAIEGYATYVEGALTGSGRPHAGLRAAVLRGWALEGALPGYGALSGGGGYLGGSFAYLMGSAYLEWLAHAPATRPAPAVLAPSLGARQPGVDRRSPDVYGEGPGALLRALHRASSPRTPFALRADSTRRRVEGTLDQRLRLHLGRPGLSPATGERLALRDSRAGPTAPVADVVLSGGATRVPRGRAADIVRGARDAAACCAATRRTCPPCARSRARGAPIPSSSRRTARRYHEPRFFADGRRVLVSRSDLTSDDVVRPDLYVWDTGTGRVTRVTSGADVRDADPAPDGRSAVAVRCAGGSCDVVRVDLAGGAATVIARGSPTTTWTRPRWAPDGTSVVAGVQQAGRWRLAILDPSRPGAAPAPVGPDDGAERYDATFTPDGRALVYTSERGGVANLVRLDLGRPRDERPLTRVATAAFAPAVSAAEPAVYFLHLTPHGLDLRRLAPDSTPVRGEVVPLLAASPTPARDSVAAVRIAVAQRPGVGGQAAAAPAFAAGPVRVRGYGLGPRHFSLLPIGAVTPDGGSAGAQVAAIDPVGRLSVLVQGAAGSPRTWRGGSVRAAWRGLPVTLTGELFAVRQALAAAAPNAGGVAVPGLGAPTELRGAALLASGGRWLVGPARPAPGASALAGPDTGRASRPRVVVGPRGVGPEVRVAGRLGASLAGGPAGATSDRRLAFAELSGSAGRAVGEASAGAAIGAQLSGGRTAGAGWRRVTATARLTAGSARGGVAVDGAFAAVDRGAPAFERPLVGGSVPVLFDPGLLSQRLAVAALPTGFRAGRQAAAVRVGLGGLVATPYVSTVGAGDGRLRWARLAGLERRFDGPFAPFARLPRVRVVAGVARVFDAPLRDRTRAYLSATFTP
jgi:hypothetical protein